MIMPEKLHKIKVRSIEGVLLTFTQVKDYTLKGGLIEFVDSKTGEVKTFSTSQCEIQEETNK